MTRANGSIPILRPGGTLPVTIPADLRDQIAQAFQEDVLTQLEDLAANSLVIDVSGLETVDTLVARVLADTRGWRSSWARSRSWWGCGWKWAGTLVRMGYSIEGVESALNFQEDTDVLRKLRRRRTAGRRTREQ